MPVVPNPIMIDRIRHLFGAGPAPAPADRHDVRVAAAALLVVAARQDEGFDAREEARIRGLLSQRFGLTAEEVDTLMDKAVAHATEAVQILPFTRAIKAEFGHDERVEMVEMLWEVVYADGVLQDHEATLMRRIGGLIYVTDRERGEARKRALRTLKKAGIFVPKA